MPELVLRKEHEMMMMQIGYEHQHDNAKNTKERKTYKKSTNCFLK
jgi:hypothetical protein